jgi:hypothetical protein
MVNAVHAAYGAPVLAVLTGVAAKAKAGARRDPTASAARK